MPNRGRLSAIWPRHAGPAQGHSEFKKRGLTLAEIALLLADRDNGELDARGIQQLAAKVLTKIDSRIAGLQVIRGYVAPVAVGDMRVLQDEDCHFVFEFMTALSTAKAKRRA